MGITYSKGARTFTLPPHWLIDPFLSLPHHPLQPTTINYLLKYLHLISSSHNVTQSPTPMSGDTLFLKFDDRNPAFTYGPGWSNLTDVNAYDSTLSYTPNKTNVTIQFYGTFYPQRYTPFVTDQPYRTAPRKCLVAFRCHRKNRRMEPTCFPLHSR